MASVPPDAKCDKGVNSELHVNFMSTSEAMTTPVAVLDLEEGETTAATPIRTPTGTGSIQSGFRSNDDASNSNSSSS